MNYYFPPIVIWFLEFVPNIFVVMVYFPFLSRIVFFFIIIFCVIRQPCHINKYETKHTENSDHAHFESSTRQGENGTEELRRTAERIWCFSDKAPLGYSFYHPRERAS